MKDNTLYLTSSKHFKTFLGFIVNKIKKEMSNKDIGAKFIMRKSTLQEECSPTTQTESLCTHLSIQVFFYCCLPWRKKESLLKECEWECTASALQVTLDALIMYFP